MVKVITRSIPNSQTARGYTIVQVPGFRNISDHNKLSSAKAKAKMLAKKNKGNKGYIIRADMFEVFYSK